MPRDSRSRSRRARDRLTEPVGGPKLLAAAICFRRREQRLQFRLVRDRDGACWAFPQGPSRPDEALPQAAAREAGDQAGVTGVVAEQPLTQYVYGRRSDDLAAAFLLAVQSTAPFGAQGHDPTWFDPATARKKLGENRESAEARELQRVIDVAEQELEDG